MTASQISGGIFDLDSMKSEVESLEKKTLEAGFWDNHEDSQVVQRKISRLKEKIELWDDLKDRSDDLDELFRMIMDEWTPDLFEELESSLKSFLTDLHDAEVKNLLGEENDEKNAIFSIHAGAGGTESCDWVSMLLRMYVIWCEKNGYGVTFIDETLGDVAGIKSITFIVKGDWAYGYLKSEIGVHRLVRISPFDANKRRHTSFAAIEIFPEISDDIQIDFGENDLKIDTYRASSAGGQHVNKTDSAVRITHLPTGIVVQCQNERSQHKNKDVALKILKARLYEKERREQEVKKEESRRNQKEIAFGSQIRSYVFQPYQLVKDLRTGFETGNVQSVMDGEIGSFITEYLKWRLSNNSEDNLNG